MKNLGKVAFAAFLSILALPADVMAEWTLLREKDAFTDKISVVARTSNRTGAIIARCKDAELDMYVVVGEFLSNEGVRFRYRLDDQTAVERRGPPSADGLAVFFNEPQVHAREMMKANRILFEVFDYRGVGHRRSFSLAGSGKAIIEVLKACGSRLTNPAGVDMDIIGGVDGWSEKFTKLAKESLIEKGSYAGAVDATKPDALYAAVQGLKKPYTEYCRNQKVYDKYCPVYMTAKDDVLTRNVVKWHSSPTMRHRRRVSASYAS